MAYLVDANIMVDFTRGNAKAADYLDSLGGACLLSSITALELIAGARSQREVNDLDIMISAYEQIEPTPGGIPWFITFSQPRARWGALGVCKRGARHSGHGTWNAPCGRLRGLIRPWEVDKRPGNQRPGSPNCHNAIRRRLGDPNF
jgi:hypothetical protein